MAFLHTICLELDRSDVYYFLLNRKFLIHTQKYAIFASMSRIHISLIDFDCIIVTLQPRFGKLIRLVGIYTRFCMLIFFNSVIISFFHIHIFQIPFKDLFHQFHGSMKLSNSRAV